MLVTFSTKSYSNIMMFDDIATRLLHMMGNSATIPGALVADEVPEALRQLKSALNMEGGPQLAADASDDGARKLDQAWRVGEDAEGTGLAGLRLPLDRAALSVAMGRDNVVHMALADPAAAARVSLALSRLMHFLGGSGPIANPGGPMLAGSDD